MDTLPLKFWFENAHFVIFVLGALSFFIAGWLNLDSYRQKPGRLLLVRVIGFFVLTLWALAMAPNFDIPWVQYLIIAAEFIGIGLVVAGFYMRAMPKRVVLEKATPVAKKKMSMGGLGLASLSVPKMILLKLPIIGWLLALIRIWRLATTGLIKDLLGLRTAFLFFFLSRVFSLAELFQGSDNPQLFNLAKEFSYLWTIENVLFLIGAILLIKWAFYYIYFRPAPQLYTTFVTTAFIVFIVSTVAFTGTLFSLSLKNSKESLERSAAVFEFSLKELKNQTNLAAYSLAQRDLIIEGARENDVGKAKTGLGDPIKELNVSGAAVVNRAGEVLAVVGAYLDVGESLVADPAVINALDGKQTQSYVIEKLLDADELVVRAAFPIVVESKVQGATIVDFPIDQAFVESVKAVTDLDVAINSGDVHTAATFKDQNDRIITGTRITNDDVLKLIQTDKKAWAWSGSERLVDQSYLTAYRSIQDADGVNIGSLLVGQSIIQVIDQIDYAVKLTFLVAIILILITLFPLYFVSRSISRAVST